MHVTPPINGSMNPITVNGRTYNCPIGAGLAVPQHDGYIMCANGWKEANYVLVCGITQAAYNALTNPDPLTFYVITG